MCVPWNCSPSKRSFQVFLSIFKFCFTWLAALCCPRNPQCSLVPSPDVIATETTLTLLHAIQVVSCSLGTKDCTQDIFSSTHSLFSAETALLNRSTSVTRLTNDYAARFATQTQSRQQHSSRVESLIESQTHTAVHTDWYPTTLGKPQSPRGITPCQTCGQCPRPRVGG